MEFEAEVLPRLKKLLKDRDLGNGTPLSDAAAVAIAADARWAGVAMTKVLALTDDVLIAAADALHRHVNKFAYAERPLPFGTLLYGSTTISIGGEVYLPDAGRPGLHVYHSVRKDAHGPNLERLLAMIELRTRGQPYRVMGLPAPSTIYDIDTRHHLDFAPLTAAGGVVMRVLISTGNDDIFCALMQNALEKLADSITTAMASLWISRVSIGHRVEAVRRRVGELLASVHGPSCPVSVRLIAYNWAQDGGEESARPYLQIEYNALDDRLRPGAVLQEVNGGTDLESPQFQVYDNWDLRSRLKDRLLLEGAVGLVDELTAGVIRAAPEGEHEVLDRLWRDMETFVTLRWGADTVRATLAWHGGHIKSLIFGEDVIRSSDRDIDLRAALPQSLVAAVVGRPMSAVAELPIALDAVIEKVEEIGWGWLRFTYEQNWQVIDAETGALRPTRAGAATCWTTGPT